MNSAQPQEAVRLVEVTKIYRMPRGSVKALDRVNLSISAGDFISIMGPSGSGKSTLLNIIGCLDVPTSGEVFIAGENVSKLSEGWRTRIRFFASSSARHRIRHRNKRPVRALPRLASLNAQSDRGTTPRMNSALCYLTLVCG